MNIQKSTLISWCIVIIASIVVCVAKYNNEINRHQKIINSADGLMRNAWSNYYHSTFDEASNAWLAQINYLEANKSQLSKSRNLDVLLYVAHAHLAYMLLSCSNEIDALAHIEFAHKYYLQMQAEMPNKNHAKSEFLDYIISGIESNDAKNTIITWKSKHNLNTNVVDKVKNILDQDSKHTPVTKGHQHANEY
jgi:hypothetical protein